MTGRDKRERGSGKKDGWQSNRRVKTLGMCKYVGYVEYLLYFMMAVLHRNSGLCNNIRRTFTYKFCRVLFPKSGMQVTASGYE